MFTYSLAETPINPNRCLVVKPISKRQARRHARRATRMETYYNFRPGADRMIHLEDTATKTDRVLYVRLR